MLTTVKTAISLLGLFLLTQSLAFAADLFQWTDARGVIHFTDRLEAVPETVQQSTDLIVRPNFFSPVTTPVMQVPAPSAPLTTRPPIQDSQWAPYDTGPSPLAYAPPETIVVVNSGVQPINQASCIGNKCGFAFRHRFNGPNQHRAFIGGAGSTFPGGRGAIVLGARSRR